MRATSGGELLYHDGQLVQRDQTHPVWGYYPTSSWERDEVVRDDYQVAIPAGLEYDGAMVVVYSVTGEGFEDLGTVSFPLSRD